MNLRFKYALGLLVCLVAIGWFYNYMNQCDCKKRISYEHINVNSELDQTQLFEAISPTEKAEALSDWASFNINSDSFFIEVAFDYSASRKIKVVAHYTNNQKHYGAVIYPAHYNENKAYPMLVWANGLNQADPTVDIRKSHLQQLFRNFPNYFIVVPSYRGQALVVAQKRYCSDGFFGDAFDGATDDALRLAHLTEKKLGNVDKSRKVALGVSRGGTVALLIGIRDTTFNCIVDQSGPINFLSKASYIKYNRQFKYQFLSEKKTIEQLRKKMIKASPAYFIEQYPNNLMLIYAKQDRIVDISNGKQLKYMLKAKNNCVYHEVNGGHQFNNTINIVEWIKENND